MADAYFLNFPLRTYTLNPSPQVGEYDVVTDIFRRVAPIRNLLQRTLMFYAYEIQEGDTPELLAYKYYGSVDYHWLVSLMNNIVDPILDWPKTNTDLDRYVSDLYGSIPAAAAQTHHWTKTITKVFKGSYQQALDLGLASLDEFPESTSEVTTIIDQTMYNAMPASDTRVYTFADGGTVTETITKATVDCYTFEESRNNEKRKIVLLNNSYLSQVTKELGSLKR